MQQTELADTPTDGIPGANMPDLDADAGYGGTATAEPESAAADIAGQGGTDAASKAGTATRQIPNTFVQIKDIRGVTRARALRLQDGDLIVSIDGKPFHEDIETFLDILFENEDEAGLLLTVFRNGVLFNIITKGPLGATLEYAKPERAELARKALEKFTIESKDNIVLFEVLRDMDRACRIIDTRLSPLAYLAPPVWVVYNKLWEVLVALVMIYVSTLAVHWALFLIASVLLSLYFKRAHLVLRRSFSLVRGYHMWMVIAARSELEVQKICRQIDEKSTFEMDLVGPVEPEEKPKKRRRRQKKPPLRAANL
ncbi:MAG: hypothetical protein ISP39_04120 [Alphaproteobacteria bacterium]|nr:hypothetical protein [Alphaproteobacteria bacterium]MBL6671783.1 hypothetical protein [Alphaproteobacteria bacterium]